MFTPLSPSANIELNYNNIRIINLSLLSVILEYHHLMEPLHKTQLLGIRAKHASNNYITRGEFQMVRNIFNRYKEVIQGGITDEEKVKEVIDLYREAEAFEDEINKLQSQITTVGYKSNVEFRDRV